MKLTFSTAFKNKFNGNFEYNFIYMYITFKTLKQVAESIKKTSPCFILKLHPTLKT